MSELATECRNMGGTDFYFKNVKVLLDDVQTSCGLDRIGSNTLHQLVMTSHVHHAGVTDLHVFCETETANNTRDGEHFKIHVSTINYTESLLFQEILKFEKMVNNALKSGQIDSALDLLYDVFDEKLRAHNFPFVSKYLTFVKVANADSNILIGLLSTTVPYKRFIFNRTLFYQQVQSEMIKRYGEDESIKILKGLN